MAEGFIGKGWAFPPATDSRGGIAMSIAEAVIRESIRVILGTAPGERDMRPDFGCGVWEMIFDPIDASFEGRVEFLVERALLAWEPRIELRSVTARASERVVEVEIVYLIRETNREDNLVYPFYRPAP